jgi:23S rRNA (cytosine1962-C5)-methyltransferase
MTDSLPAVSITRKAADRLASGHPWVFSSEVAEVHAQPGDPVVVKDPKGRQLGVAHYSSASQIALRLLSRQVQPIDAAFFQTRIHAAIAHRTRLGLTGSFRLVHAEADLLPGLIIDRYGDALVLQTLTQGMDAALPLILESLEAPTILLRNDAPVREKENLPLESRLLRGSLDGPHRFSLNGLDWEADLLSGQKTGTFLDQRENHLAAARYARGKALDLFTHTGGFALHLARACDRVDAVDASPAALRAAARNAELNAISNVDFREANVFELLRTLRQAKRRFDAIVLDPPALAKSRNHAAQALQSYADLNSGALQLLRPGGVLITCSCSHHISEADLLSVLAACAQDLRLNLRILERRTQSADHPVLLQVPETHYLKCLILELL